MSKIMRVGELVATLERADEYLTMFGFKQTEDGDGLLPIEALGLAGLPREIAIAVGRLISLGPVRSFRDVPSEYHRYSEAYSDIRVRVDIALTYYVDPLFAFDASEADVIKRHIAELRAIYDI